MSRERGKEGRREGRREIGRGKREAPCYMLRKNHGTMPPPGR